MIGGIYFGQVYFGQKYPTTREILSLSDELSVSDAIDSFNMVAEISDTLSIEDVLTFGMTAVLSDILSITDSLETQWTAFLTLADELEISDSLIVSIFQTLLDYLPSRVSSKLIRPEGSTAKGDLQ